jgi:serine/threonine-protein kinase
VPAFPLDRQAKYFLVLVALCEPRLRGASLAALPTTAQVADRLRRLPGCEQLTPRAVDFHIEYLVRRKLRLRSAEARAGDDGRAAAMSGTDGKEGFAARRMLLADFVLRFGIVAEDDLALLPRRPRPSSSEGDVV